MNFFQSADECARRSDSDRTPAGSPSPALRRSADRARPRRLCVHPSRVPRRLADPDRSSAPGLCPGSLPVYAEDCAFIAAVIHNHLTLSVDSHQRVVVLALDALLADNVALFVLDELRRVFSSFSLTSPTYPMTCAANPSCGYSRRCALNQFHLRESLSGPCGIRQRQVRRRKLLLEDDRLVLGPFAEPAITRDQIVVVQMRGRPRSACRCSSFRFSRDRISAERRVVVDDDPAVAIEDLAARREQRKRLDAVPLGLFAVNAFVPTCRSQKPKIRKTKDRDSQVLENGDLRRGETVFSLRRTLCWRCVRPLSASDC